jgi:hypothetical protein
MKRGILLPAALAVALTVLTGFYALQRPQVHPQLAPSAAGPME